jgi:hypothetical protein
VGVGVIGRHAQGFLGNPIAYWRLEKLKFGGLPLVCSSLHYAFANINRTVFNGITCGLQRITRACNALWVRRQQSFANAKLKGLQGQGSIGTFTCT